MRSSIFATFGLVLSALVFSGCYAEIRTATNVTATSATFNAKGRSACGQGGVFRFEYATSKAVVNNGTGKRTAVRNFGESAFACGENPTNWKFGQNVTGLLPNSTYYYRLCGHDNNSTNFACTKATQFTTWDAPGSDFPHITTSGNQLMAGTKSFRVFGFNTNIVDAYFANPTEANKAEMKKQMASTRSIGANTARIYLQLFDFVEFDANHNVVVKQDAINAYKEVLAEAERDHLYLDVTGNLVWHPEGNVDVAYYDTLSNLDRWKVSAAFWSAIAQAGADSPAVLCYELNSEPSVSSNPEQPWYGGHMGTAYFTPTVARGVPAGEGLTYARFYAAYLRNTIRLHDTRHAVTIGALPFGGAGAPFGPTNMGDILDILIVHDYPGIDITPSLTLIQQFAAPGKPVVIGETFILNSSLEAQEAFYLQTKPYVSGVMPFYAGIGPDDYPDYPGGDSIPALLGQMTLSQFLGLRDQLIA